MATFPVKWFSSDMGGAPTLGDTASGDFNALIKACLITGFNLMPISDMTHDSGTGLVTATLGGGHGFVKWQVVEVSGADQAEYNGQFRVADVGTDWIAFAPDAVPSASPATGASLEIKAAPQGGWELVDEDATNHHLALRSTAADATPHVLMITNDGWEGGYSSGSNIATLRCLESFTDFSTYEEAITQYWPASHRSFDPYVERNAQKKDWLLVADDKLLYFIPAYTMLNRRSCMVAGLIKSLRPGDAHHFILNGIEVGSGAEWDRDNEYALSDLISPVDAYMKSYTEGGSTNDQSPNYRRLARAHHQLPGSAPFGLMITGRTFPPLEYEEKVEIQFPNPADNGFYVAANDLPVLEPGGLRGTLPGLVQPLNGGMAYFNVITADLPGFNGEPVLFWRASASRNNTYHAYSWDGDDHLVGLRLGPWRPEVG